MFHTLLETPIGIIRLRATNQGLLALDHTNQQAKNLFSTAENPNHPILKQATQELEEYFQGTRTTFQTPLAPSGTPFQLQVWKALTTIPYGKTTSYASIAEKIGNPKAVRAVGAANGRNPLSIFIPCHRVIGKSGKLVGYAGGLDAKTTLLTLESKHQK